MSGNEYIHCRLCAELKPYHKLVHLITLLIPEEGHCQDIVKRLSRFNIQINLYDNNLPKMACITCVESLQRAFDFFSAVERAQSTLNDLILKRQVTKEENVSDDENIVYALVNDVFPADYENETQDNEIEDNEIEDNEIEDNEIEDNETEDNEIEDNETEDNEIDDNEIEDNEIGDNETEDVKIESNKTDSTSKSSLENNTENLSGGKKKRYLCTSVDTLSLSELKMTWKDYEWLCSHCETQFPTFEELQNHSMQYHKVCNPYKCTDCKAKIFRLDRFLKHLKGHRKYLKFSCYKCHIKFITTKEASKHMAKHKETDHVCSGCNVSFKCQEELADHTSTYCKGPTRFERTVDNTEGELSIVGDSLTCPVCNKTYNNKRSLTTHMWIHTRKQRDHICEICGKCFYLRGNLVSHMIKHSDAKPYQCDLCKSSFKTLRQLRRHIMTHDRKKPFSCDQCGKCFRLKEQLTRHSIVHTDSFPHVCSYCNKGFRFKTMMNVHLLQHTGAKPYSCEICQKDFTDWSNYNKHMKRRHNTDMAKKKRTPQGALPVDPVTGEIINPDKVSLTKKKRRQTKTAAGKGKDKNSNSNE